MSASAGANEAIVLRSLLFVPGDRPDRMRKALGSGADALILDLEDAVAPEKKLYARESIAGLLAAGLADMPIFVRINSLDSPDLAADIALVAASRPAGVMLPKAESGASIANLDRILADAGVEPLILPIAMETPAAPFALQSYIGSSPRLCGMTWGIEDLAAAVGAVTVREDDGRLTAPYEVVRALLLFAAHAAGVQAIETVYPAINDIDGLAAHARRARRDGFSGMIAIHPAQVPVINEAFAPTPEERGWAERVIEAFDSNPGAGALKLDGRLIDAPHLARARRILPDRK